MKPYEAWLVKAEHDLGSARKLIEGDMPFPDTAIYHAQQCAEKALKAYLSYKQQPIQKTHNLSLLIELCSKIDESFMELLSDANELVPYGIAFRYPDIDMEPDKEEVIAAIAKAERILGFTKKIIMV